MSLILQVNNASGGGGSGAAPPSSSAGGGNNTRITLSKPPVQVAIATAVKHHHHAHPLLETHFLPQGPPATLRMPMALPSSPLRPGGGLPPRHLPNTPLPPSIHRGMRAISKHSPLTAAGNPPTHCIMVNPSRPTTLTMLPQAPPGLLSTAAATPGGLLSTTVGLIPIPRVQLQPAAAPLAAAMAVPSSLPPPPASSSSTIILPPNTLHHQLFPPLKHNEEDSCDELDVDEPEGLLSRSTKLNRVLSPKSRFKNRPMALQDHNYASIPISPPTPPPPPSIPTTLPSVASSMPKAEPEDRLQQPPTTPGAHKPFNVPEFLGHETVASTTVCSSSSNNINSGNSLPPRPPVSPVVSRTQANLNSIQAAGVGPMSLLIEDDSVSMSSGDDKGEETETAPEAEEAEDDSITRCICDFLHDDGYMICCDKCSVWQHVVCMGLDRNNIPDEYLCEVCKPRQIDRKRAKSLQARRRTEIFKNSSSSDDEHNENKNSLSNKRSSLSKKLEANKKSTDSKISSSSTSSSSSLKRQKLKKSSSDKELHHGTNKPPTKKNYRKKKSSSGSSSLHNNNNSIKKMTRRRVNSSYPEDADTNDDDDEEEEFDTDDLEPKFETGQQLRSWIDQYEEAVTNHYSPELRARLSGHKNGSGELRSSAINAPTRCTVSLQGNGIKILTANCNITSNTPIIECKGRIMLASQYRASNKDQDYCTSPHVLFYRLSEFLEIVVDGKTYGNDSRFCRRSSTNHNAELRHVVDKGSLHIFIVTTKSLEKYQEILLPTELRRLPRLNGGTLSSSIQDDVREIRGRPSLRSLPQNIDDDDDVKENESSQSPPPPPPTRRKKRNSERSSAARKTFSRGSSSGGSNPKVNRRNNLKVPSKSADSTTTPSYNDADADDERGSVKVVNGEEAPIKEEEEMQSREEQHSPDPPTVSSEHPTSKEEEDPPHPSSSPSQKSLPSSKVSPNKLGLPDNSGLIVGVNTINYDASSSLRNKSKSREERKMEMIMKAIEAMEKAEQRKKETGGLELSGTPGGGTQSAEKVPTKRRRSSSVKMSNVDSNLELSSADESKSMSENQHPNKKMKKKAARKTPNPSSSPQRRRALSGGCSADENPSSSSSGDNNQFRFPKTKKMIMSDWLNQEEDDVSSNYLRGSRSPPGIATHLLRSAPLSPVKSVCSAKKRWLRQAISEDHSEDPKGKTDEAGSVDPAVSDSVTPLKKRRLANYKEEESQQKKGDEEQEVVVRPSPPAAETPSLTKENLPPEESKVVPSALKKKLLQNLVLEAVLDSAMEDMLSNVAATPKEEEEEEEDLPCQQEELKQEQSSSSPPKTDELKNNPEEEDKSSSSAPEIKTEPQDDHSIKVEKKEEEYTPPNTIKEESCTPEEEDLPSAPIKTPEPSSAFKSFFKSSVSLEDLEAELEASRRMREESTTTTTTSVVTEKEERLPPMESSVSLPPTKTEDDFPVEEEKQLPPIALESSSEPPKAPPSLSQPSSKPKEKKRVSLADYKRRRKQGSVPPQNEGSSPSTPKEVVPPQPPPSLALVVNNSLASSTTLVPSGLVANTQVPLLPSSQESDEPGTPTLDEDQPVTMPTLNTLPLFEKLEQLEKAQRENCKKKVPVATTSSSVDLSSLSASSAPTTNSERKREDLTERLKKEFGLVVEETHQEELKAGGGPPLPDGDATPESSSPHILPPTGSLSGSSGSRFSSFTPTQYPSYPSNYPLPPYPASKTAAAPHPPPSVLGGGASSHGHPPPSGLSHSHHSRRGGSDYNYSTSSHGGGSNRNYYSSSSSRVGRYRDRDYRDKDHHSHHHHSSHRSSSRNYRSSSSSYYP